jgi:sarcosine oxidase subunit gamma
MGESPCRESPLIGVGQAPVVGDHRTVRIEERPFRGYLNLRGSPADAAFVRATGQVLGVGLPIEPNTVSTADDVSVAWLGPDEWLIMTAPDAGHEVRGRLAQSLAGMHIALSDIGCGHTTVSISGPATRALLAKVCTLDLHPRVFGPGRCAQTHLAGATVVLLQTDAPPGFEIVVRRSFADYLWRRLEDAACEFQRADMPSPA